MHTTQTRAGAHFKAMGLKKRYLKRWMFFFFEEDFKELTDRNRELVPDSWRLVRERVLSTGLHAEGLYSESLECLQKSGAAEKECKSAQNVLGWLFSTLRLGPNCFSNIALEYDLIIPLPFVATCLYSVYHRYCTSHTWWYITRAACTSHTQLVHHTFSW